jgi:putative transcriptional regulator
MLNVTLPTRRQIPKRPLFTTAVIPLLQLALSLGMPRGAAAFSDQQAAMLPAGLSTALTALNPPQPHPALAKGKFLVASRRLGDPNFVETVILLLAYDEKGAMGVVINRPTEARLSTLLSEVKGLQKRPDVVYLGGPVGRSQMLILARSNGQVEQSLRVFEDVYTVAGQRMLEQLIHEVGARAKFRAYLGYAGWGAGQLDFEVAQGGWHVLPADAATVFNKPSAEIWPELIRRGEAQWVKRQTPNNQSKKGTLWAHSMAKLQSLPAARVVSARRQYGSSSPKDRRS